MVGWMMFPGSACKGCCRNVGRAPGASLGAPLRTGRVCHGLRRSSRLLIGRCSLLAPVDRLELCRTPVTPGGVCRRWAVIPAFAEHPGIPASCCWREYCLSRGMPSVIHAVVLWAGHRQTLVPCVRARPEQPVFRTSGAIHSPRDGLCCRRSRHRRLMQVAALSLLSAPCACQNDQGCRDAD